MEIVKRLYPSKYKEVFPRSRDGHDENSHGGSESKETDIDETVNTFLTESYDVTDFGKAEVMISQKEAGGSFSTDIENVSQELFVNDITTVKLMCLS